MLREISNTCGMFQSELLAGEQDDYQEARKGLSLAQWTHQFL